VQEALPREVFLKFLESIGKNEEQVFKQEEKRRAPNSELGDDDFAKQVNKNLIKTQKIKVSNKSGAEPKGPKVSSSAGQANIMSFFNKK
jgi:hypothetical protein